MQAGAETKLGGAEVSSSVGILPLTCPRCEVAVPTEGGGACPKCRKRVAWPQVAVAGFLPDPGGVVSAQQEAQRRRWQHRQRREGVVVELPGSVNRTEFEQCSLLTTLLLSVG